MNDTEFHNGNAGQEPSLPRMYSPTLQPLLQSLLATLADIDFEYERERDKASKNLGNINLKIQVLERLKAKHRERRAPYIQQLVVLQEQMLKI
jgi:hypothetical protein